MQMKLETKQQLFVVGSYLMVFLFGWMCALFTISDSTNPKVETPVIGGTAKDCLNAGCTDHISKPIQSSELFSMLKLYLKTSYKKEGA